MKEMKEIKAWAVGSDKGSLWLGYVDALVVRTKKAAEDMKGEGERVVRVTVRIEE